MRFAPFEYKHPTLLLFGVFKYYFVSLNWDVKCLGWLDPNFAGIDVVSILLVLLVLLGKVYHRLQELLTIVLECHLIYLFQAGTEHANLLNEWKVLSPLL
jgi:hypothetical protein